MKINKTVWMPSALVFGLTSFSFLVSAGLIFFSVSGFTWPRISEELMWGLSQPAFRQVVIMPIVLALIMLIGITLNIEMSGDIKKLNKLFLVLLITVAIPVLFKNVFAGWATISVLVAWLLQRYESKRIHNKAIEPDFIGINKGNHGSAKH